MSDILNRFLLWFEDQSKGNADYESKGGKDKPACLPVAFQESVLPMAEAIDDLASSQRTDSGTDTIGHHHKQSLRRSLDRRFALLVDKDTARDIEEVEGYSIDDA